MVWVPKKRRKIVYGKLRKEIGEILRRLNEYKDVDVIEGKACIDHPHLFGDTAVNYMNGNRNRFFIQQYAVFSIWQGSEVFSLQQRIW